MNPAGLLPRQIPAVEQLLAALRKNGAALDGSDMGTGKTYVAGGVMRELDLPTLVVCPAISISQWKKMGDRLGVEFDALNYEMLRTGKTPYGSWTNVKQPGLRILRCNVCQLIVNPARPQACPHHRNGIHCVETRTAPHRYGRFRWHPGVKMLVFDEVHRCSAEKSLHADMLIAARRQNIPTLSLSATVADNPLALRAIGFSLGLHNLDNFYFWVRKRGCYKMPFGGFHFTMDDEKRREIMAGLNSEIFPSRGVRTRIADLPDFPECQIDAELFDLVASGRIDALYAEMSAAVDQLNAARAGDADHHFNLILHARMHIELLKVPIFVELTRDAIAEGRHVALFCNYRQTVDELCSRLGTDCRIDGSQTGAAGARERQRCIDAFQDDDAPAIVCSAPAGSACIGLHDVRGYFPRLGLISPGYSAREFRQECGRLRREGAKSKAFYRAILVKNTVEEKVHKALVSKLDNLDALLDADLWATNLPLIHRAAG